MANMQSSFLDAKESTVLILLCKIVLPANKEL